VIDMSKSYSFTDEQSSYIEKMAKRRGIEPKEAAQNLMDKGISRDKALSAYQEGKGGSSKPKKAKAPKAPKAKASSKKAAAKKASPKKARAKVSSKPDASKANGAATNSAPAEA
jgi:hypothetical protein